MKTIDDINFKDKKAIIRVDFNVPLNDRFEITDTTRIDATLPTIRKILNDGGKVILMSHLGRPKNGPEEKFSLKHLLPYLSKNLNADVKFADDCIGETAKNLASELKSGEVLLLENLRFYKEEKKGDKNFAKKLASLADIYVNDAFGTAHRAHASTSIIADFFPGKKVFGYVMSNEIQNIDKTLKDTKRPFTAILGGAKISGKIQIINNLLEKADNIIIGGAMMFTFIKALAGKVGKSLIEDDFIDIAMDTLNNAKKSGVNIYLPIDAVIADEFSENANFKNSKAYDIPDEWMGLDIGEKTCKKFDEVIKTSKTILWNGPMGVFEMKAFENGTKSVAESIAQATENGAFSLIGGGDSVAAIKKFNLQDKISYISTGGGALLEYIEGKKLPGIKAIEE
ncbi:MAG: phosphoglycerate kinase [Bacteroidales bacterium]|nr:phosphoglycerate kinase [Bacteroidales bacterium]